MGCLQTLNGITTDCSTSMGGLKEVYIANYDDVTATTITDGEITAITMASGSTFKKYQFRRNTANMTSTLAVDPANGSTVSTDVVMSFLKQETTKRIEISALSVGELVVLVKDANDKLWYLGKDFPVMASAGTGESGTNYTDGNRYSITLQDNSMDWPYEVKVAPAGESDTNYVDLEDIVS